MPRVIYTETNDEIVDLVDRVRTASDPDVALVLNPGTTGFQTPLNVRLLRQLGTRSGKTVSVISGDQHIQELSRVGGLPTYASVPAFERGIQTIRPHPAEGPTAAALGAGVAYPPGPPPPPPRATTRGPGAAATRAKAAGRRRALYFVAAGIAVVGFLLFFLVAPTAKVTITLAGTPLTASPTIQGSPDPANAGQADHLVTTVVTSNQSAQFTATPSGTQQLPARPAAATVVISGNLSAPAQLLVPKGEEFDTQDNPPIRFFATQATPVCVSGTAIPCPAGSNSSVPVADGTPEAKGNVAVGAIMKWPGDPCGPPKPSDLCTPRGSDFTVTNPAAASGGADAKTQVVASAADVTKWTTQVTQSEQTLTTQATQDMLTKAAGKTIAKDPGGNGTSVACSVTPPLPAANAVFAAAQITVACVGKAATYNPGDVTSVVTADLQAQVAQGDSLATSSINCTKEAVTQAADDGTVVLSIQCTSFSKPTVDLVALKGQLTGRSPNDVKNIIEHRFNHVQNVTVSQSPVPFFWLPFFAGRIEIDEAFVRQTSQ